MKQLFLLGISAVAVAVCAVPPASAENPAGSPANTTTYYDGLYTGNWVVTTSTGEQCPNIAAAPTLTIYNGAAQFQELNLSFRGYVTPQGALSMQSAGGQTFQGQFDASYGLKGRVTGRCIYDATWSKYTTSLYDGTYSGTSMRTSPGPTNEPCPNIPVAPALHIQNGVGEFRALNLAFRGYVAPDGRLSMQAESGQTFQGQFYGTGQTLSLAGRIIGKCVYDATWGRGG
jgi:hypothetical protein